MMAGHAVAGRGEAGYLRDPSIQRGPVARLAEARIGRREDLRGMGGGESRRMASARGDEIQARTAVARRAPGGEKRPREKQ